jgi:predicted alpha/beta superfamily hydrolase
MLAVAFGVATPLQAQGSELREESEVLRPVAIPRSQHLVLESKALGRTYDLHIKLPLGYGAPERASARYPVLYLNDATYNFQVAAGITHLPMNAQTIEDVILVGIGYSLESVGDDSRIRDYTPTVAPGWKKQTGGAAAYLTFVENEVIPLVEQRFRVDSKRRAYAGHSLGGLFGAYVLFNKPDLFCCYILSSPSLWYDEHVMWKLEQAYAEKHQDLQASIYVAIGSLEHPHRPRGSTYEMVKDVQTFESKLRLRKYASLKIRSAVIDGATHETAFPTALMNGVLWHFAKNRQIPFGY